MPFSMTNYQPLSAEQSSPLSAAISGLLKGVNAAPGFKKSMTEAKYAPQTIQADIISKSLAPLATIASNPYVWATMSPEQQNSLGQLISSFMGKTLGGTNGGTNGGIGGGSSNNGNNFGMSSPSASSNQGSSPQQQMGNGQGNISPNPQNAENLNIPRTPLPGNPQSGPYYNVKQGESSAGQMGTTNVSDWSEINKQASKESTDQANLKNLADDFDTYYHELSPRQKGFVGGYLPSFGDSNVQNADRIAKAASISLAQSVQSGHITDNDFQLFSPLKFSRTENADAEKSAVAMVKGAAGRGNEHIAFNNSAQNLGLTPNQANTIWSTYIHEKPYFNPNKNEIIKENVNGWKDYLKPDKANSILSGDYTIKPYKYAAQSKMVDYKTPDGKTWSVPEDRLPEVKAYVAKIKKQQGQNNE
jgi:hypothetical protein